MATNRKDIYSAMPMSPFGGFGAVERETEIVTSPMRSQAPKRKRKAKKKPAYLDEKAAPNPEMMKKSLERMFEEKIASLDDDVLDTLFPDGDNEAIDKFVAELDEKWIFEGVTGVLRRALGRRRRRRKDEEGDEISMKSAYTKPELRENIKRRIMAGSKGGKPGQWSARKAQLVAQEYEKAGGGYTGKKSKKQRSLSKWTDEKWTTSDGKPAIREGGTTRYLPEKAWDKLTPAQRDATNRKKREGSRGGRQFVPNTDAAERAGASARKTDDQSEVEEKAAKKPVLRDPKGGLTAAGRAHFKRTEGANLKPGVKGAADTPEKMRRKGSFLTRFFTNPSGPMVGENGKPTRLALSAAAWGEPVPKNRSDAAKLAAKGRRLLERYEKTKKKK
jgi:hypothetical protein